MRRAVSNVAPSGNKFLRLTYPRLPHVAFPIEHMPDLPSPSVVRGTSQVALVQGSCSGGAAQVGPNAAPPHTPSLPGLTCGSLELAWLEFNYIFSVERVQCITIAV